MAKYVMGDQEFEALCRFVALAVRFPAPAETASGYKFTKHERELFKDFAAYIPDMLLFYVTMLASGDVAYESLEGYGIEIQKIVRERLKAIQSASPSSEGGHAGMPAILKSLLDEGKKDQPDPGKKDQPDPGKKRGGRHGEANTQL